MGLLTAGYFPTTYWSADYWNDDYWLQYGDVPTSLPPSFRTLIIHAEDRIIYIPEEDRTVTMRC